MRTAKQSDGWWILDVPAYQVDGATFTSCGPYATRAEADDDRRGLERFYRDELKQDDSPVSKTSNRVMVSVPLALKQRLDRLAAEMLDSYERGNGYSNMELTEQGSRGTWIPLHAVISRALDELEGHRTRSNKRKTRSTRTAK